MRRWLTAAAVVVLSASLGACSQGSTSDPTGSATSASPVASASPSASATKTPAATDTTPASAEPSSTSPPPRDLELDEAQLEQVKWVDGSDGAPALEFDPPLGVSGATARLIADGDGELIKEGDSVTFDYSMWAGDTGEAGFTTYGTDKSQTISVRREGMSNTFADLLIDHHVGAKIIFATVDSSGMTVSDYLVTQLMAVTVTATRTVAQRAEGTPVDPVNGLPTVTLADDGTPSIDIPKTRAPSQLVSQYLIRGEGAALESGQTAIVQFTGWVWASGEQFDSTWQTHTAMTWRLSTEAVIPGLARGLVGKRVGSQVLLVVPPSLGLGDAAQGAIPANSTLVYVVDVLDVS